MQVAWKVAGHQVPSILSHQRLHLSAKQITQESLPVFAIDEG
jgi:hypothetical protein